jgi:hypothetical protein
LFIAGVDGTDWHLVVRWRIEGDLKLEDLARGHSEATEGQNTQERGEKNWR